VDYSHHPIVSFVAIHIVVMRFCRYCTSLLRRERFLAEDRDVFVLKPHPYST